MTLCKCGCGETVGKGRTFVNKEHHLEWMVSGGAREMNALLPDEVRIRGGQTSGRRAQESGRLLEADKKGAEASKEITRRFRERHASSPASSTEEEETQR